ncbi:unnamed protein product [Brassica oleracea]|uniref:(rape) hypothetical protein n=1 Tax=Brassica napus TaxID=3708 RepID=A0A816NDE9_BRANA|nr:unnamed protein product [Brassica napus]
MDLLPDAVCLSKPQENLSHTHRDYDGQSARVVGLSIPNATVETCVALGNGGLCSKNKSFEIIYYQKAKIMVQGDDEVTTSSMKLNSKMMRVEVGVLNRGKEKF